MKRFLRYLVLPCLLTALPACDSGDPGGGGTPPPTRNVGEYLNALPSWDEFAPTDANQAPTATGEPQSEEIVVEEVKEIDENGNVTVVEDVAYACTTQPYSIKENPSQIVIYSPDREILYPGAFIQGKTHRDGQGSLLPLTIPDRAPINVSIPSISDPNGDNFRTVVPNQAVVSQAIGDIVGNATRDGLSTPSTITFEINTYHSEKQFALQFDASGRYLNFEASASGSIDREASETTVTAQFYQKMFEVVVEPPGSGPEDFFSPDFTQGDLDNLTNRGLIGPDNLPVYVSNVVYGRMMMFSLTSTASENEIRGTISAAYDGLSGGGSASLSAQQKSILQEGKIKVTSLGGDAEATLGVIRSGNWADYFTNSAPLSSAAPLSYTFRNLGDNSIASVTEAANYNIRSCEARQSTPGTFEFFAPQTLALSFTPNADGRRVADVDGDGIDDLIFNERNASKNLVAVAYGDGSGGFMLGTTQSHPETPSGGWGDFDFHVGDVNGDGSADLVWSGVATDLQRSYVAIGSGSGFDFSPAQERAGGGFQRYEISDLADVDGDGKEDLIRGTTSSHLRFWIFFGTDAGDFDYDNASGQTISTNPGFPSYTFVPIDFTGDGKADLVMNQLNADRNIIHHATAKSSPNRTASFNDLLPSRNYGFGGWQDYVRVAGQFNGQSGTDLVFVRSDGEAIHRAYSTGSTFSISTGSNFQNPNIFGTESGTIDEVVAANVNGDAFTDLVVNVLDGTANRSYVLLGQSNGIFDVTTRLDQTHPEATVAWGGYEPLVGQFDGDSRDDIVWVSTEQDNRVFVGLARE